MGRKMHAVFLLMAADHDGRDGSMLLNGIRPHFDARIVAVGRFFYFI